MSFVNALKKMGLVNEDAPAAPKVEFKPSSAPPTIPTSGMKDPVVDTSGRVSSHDYRKLIEEELKKRNIPGPDYLEFSEAMAKIISDTSMSEQQKFKTLYLSFEAMGLNAQKLVSSAKQYLVNLNEFRNGFISSMEVERKTGVTDLEKEIQESEEQLRKLTLSIENKKKKLEENRIVLNVEENAFNNAYNSKIQSINEDIEKIQKYLTNEPVATK